MVQLITFLISITAGQAIVTAQTTPDKYFGLIDDFERNKMKFRADEFDLNGHSTEGGKATAFHNKERDYLVVDIWIFGEMGKVNATYWVDKKFNFLIVKRTDFQYDKPFYEKDFKVTEAVNYLSYSPDNVRAYDNERKQLTDALAAEMKRMYEEFFNELTMDLEIVK